MNARASIAILAVLTVSGCASIARRPAPPPDFSPIAGSPATIGAKLYAACVGQAANAGAFDVTSQGGGHLLRFTCSGQPAEALYTALGPWSAARRSEWTAAGRTWRSTARIARDLFGVDYCSAREAADYRCSITLNVGDFLAN